MMLAIAGSRRVSLPWVAAPLMQLVAELPSTSIVLLRKPRNGPPNPFEAEVEHLVRLRGLVPLFMVPEAGRNRTGTFIRDIELVDNADAVLVFLSPDEDPLGEGGTAHVLQKAIDAGKPLYAYAVMSDGLEWLGGVERPRSLQSLSDALSDTAITD